MATTNRKWLFPTTSHVSNAFFRFTQTTMKLNPVTLIFSSLGGHKPVVAESCCFTHQRLINTVEMTQRSNQQKSVTFEDGHHKLEKGISNCFNCLMR